MRVAHARHVLATAALLLAAGCIPQEGVRSVDREISLDATPDGESEVYVDLIERLLANEQYYAALAHIEEHRVSTTRQVPRLDLFEARALYGLRYDGQATAIFLRLLNGPMAGEAHHGLGLIHARRDLDKALPHFIQAVRMRPTIVPMRNDLGYALMRMGRLQDARLQLSTALELAPDDRRALHNLMLLMLMAGDERAVRQLAEESGMSRDRVEQLRADARRMMSEINAGNGGAR